MANILVNGVGTIGKRIAEAVDKQNDMELIGVADVEPSGELRTVLEEGALRDTPLFASMPDARGDLEDAGFDVEGRIGHALEEADLVVDATPAGIDEKNKEKLYEPNDVKAIFQGGAAASIAPVAFNANANFEEARGEDFVKVVSCNTTSLCRTLYAIDEDIGVDSAVANLVRRGGDPKQDSRGPINSIIPVSDVPSHHGPDVQEVMPWMDITTLAVKVPTTLSHVHMVNVELADDATAEDVLDVFEDRPRIRLEYASEGFGSTGKVVEKMRDLHRPRYDMQEATVWGDTVTVEGDQLYWIHMVHQESIVVPDNLDAIRAMLEMENRDKSMRKTNASLDLR